MTENAKQQLHRFIEEEYHSTPIPDDYVAIEKIVTAQDGQLILDLFNHLNTAERMRLPASLAARLIDRATDHKNSLL